MRHSFLSLCGSVCSETLLHKWAAIKLHLNPTIKVKLKPNWIGAKRLEIMRATQVLMPPRGGSKEVATLHFARSRLDTSFPSERLKFNKLLKPFLRDLVHVDLAASHSYCLFVAHPWCKFPVQQHRNRCGIGMRSGDCWGYLSTAYLVSWSRNKFAMTSALCHSVLSCWKQCGHKGTWSETRLR